MELGDIFWYIAVAYWIYSIFGGRKKPKSGAEKPVPAPKPARKPKAANPQKPIDSQELEWLKKINPELYKQFTGKSAEPYTAPTPSETRREKYSTIMRTEQPSVEVLDYENTPKEKWQSKYKSIKVEPSSRRKILEEQKQKATATPIDGVLKNKSLLKQAFIFSEVIKPKF
jgi:hypothetical protein